MRHRFFKVSIVVRSIALLLSGRTATLVYDDVKRNAGRTATVSEESGQRFLLAKKRCRMSWLNRLVIAHAIAWLPLSSDCATLPRDVGLRR